MRRRFTASIVGVVAGALIVAGLGTLILLTIQARRNARHDVVDLATRIASESSRAGVGGNDLLPQLTRLQNFLRQTQQLTLVVVPPPATVQLPGGLVRSDLHVPVLEQGSTVSGFHGRTAYAVVPFLVRNRRLAVVVTQGSTSAGGAGLYFLLAGAIALVVAFAVAEGLARRITQPLVSVEQAAGRIAQGDLTARAPSHPDTYPELSSLAASVNAMADSLERLRGQERQFLLSVSHDLRTPLTSIRGFAEALADGTTTDTPAAAGVIGAEARRLERLVRDLLDMAKLDAHQFQLDVRPTDLWEVVSDTAIGFTPAAEQLGLTVAVHEPVGVPEQVAADPDRLAQVVANLVENACKYAAGSIVVGTWFRPGQDATVTVDDDGPEIRPEDLGRVFERLWTNSRGQARQVGSGLGLAIVSELLVAMGGSVRAESPVPGTTTGTRMVVTLRTAPISASTS